MEPANKKSVTLPCKKYFEERLLFFIDCKYWSGKKLDADTEEMIDRSIMRAAVELKAYEYSIQMMEHEGITVIVEDRKFQPGDLMPRVEELPDTESEPTPEPTSSPESTDVI